MAAKISGRIKRAISSSLILFGVAGVLAATNLYVQNRDRNLAMGPQSNEQKDFFVDAVDRPDIGAFFKRFKPAERQKIASNLKQYEHPKIVHLAAIWLVDFDPTTRKELEQVLNRLASKYPKELADELSHNGGFQKLGVFAALKSADGKTLPHVIEQLSIPGTRANAVEYLVMSGAKVAPQILIKLEDADKDTRLAAADALGKIGYRPAGPFLRQLYVQGDPAEKAAILAALANLGDPASYEIFVEVLEIPDTIPPDRASSILALGRIGNAPSIAYLWRMAIQNPPDKSAILESLSLAGPASLGNQNHPLADRIEVAGGFLGGESDAVIREGIRSETDVSNRAASLSIGRPALASSLANRLQQLDSASNGRQIEAYVQALASTQNGRNFLAQPKVSQVYGGFIARNQSLER